MDGAALYPNGDGTFAFINNLESDFSIARINMNANLEPYEGDYIVNATATVVVRSRRRANGISEDVSLDLFARK